MFHVGQKVVCVDASLSHWGFDSGLKNGAVYTISNIVPRWDGLGVDLMELPAPKLKGHFRAYAADRFRPIVERKTDISVFTSLLNPTPQKVSESIGYDLGFTKEEIGLS